MILTSTDGHFKLLALRTMSGDELKDGFNNATSFKEEFDYVLHVCGFVRPKSALYRTQSLYKLQLNVSCRVLSDQAISKNIK